MAMFEETHVYNYPLQPLKWLRFIDDIFLIWTHGEHKLNQFVEHLNSCVESINFTMEASSKEIPFLDVLVRLDQGRLSTDLYSKPTDSHSYLKFESSHPKNCKNSIPYSQFLRV